MGIITYNGISSRDVGVVVERHPDYVTASRDSEKFHVPGRNGDVILFRDSFSNVDRSYDIAFGSHKLVHSEMARAVSEWLYSASDYVELYDSYEPDLYRMAVYEDSTDLENILNHLGRATITFNCKPQRFLRSGNWPVTFTVTGGTLRNPTRYTALPIVKLVTKGDCTLTIGDYTCNINGAVGTLILDSEMQDVYDDTRIPKNLNQYVTTTNGFPKLEPGLTTVSFTSNITKVEVVPKWWTL